MMGDLAANYSETVCNQLVIISFLLTSHLKYFKLVSESYVGINFCVTTTFGNPVALGRTVATRISVDNTYRFHHLILPINFNILLRALAYYTMLCKLNIF